MVCCAGHRIFITRRRSVVTWSVVSLVSDTPAGAAGASMSWTYLSMRSESPSVSR